MAVKSQTKKEPARNWKTRYEEQKFLLNSMTSLLGRYGSSIEQEQLYSAFLLTLMGQFLVSDAAYYAFSQSERALIPTLAYGRIGKSDLPPVTLGSALIEQLRENAMPALIDSLPPVLSAGGGMKLVRVNYRMFAPLFLKDKLIGSLFLGDKVSGRPFTPSDMEVLYALCSVSATTFNNAILYENARHSAREIQRLQDVRNEVISRITHEFRTPLTIIKAGVEMLGKDDTHKELTKLFTESEERLEDLINSLLSLSQLNSGEEHREYRTDALSMLHETIHRFSNSAGEKKIQFHLVQQPTLSRAELNVSEEDFRTILNALFENAVKFSPHGAIINVEVDRSTTVPIVRRDGLQLPDWRQQTEDLIKEYQDISASDSGSPLGVAPQEKARPSKVDEYLVIRISDTGIGIPEEDLLSVAEPFRQASNSPDLGVKGGGLGLALVHKVVTRHGGYLCCKSSEGSGTTFSVFLPFENELV
jgi:signal transduction histidine kinase